MMTLLMTNRTAEVIPLAKAAAKLDDVAGTPSDALGRIKASAPSSLVSLRTNSFGGKGGLAREISSCPCLTVSKLSPPLTEMVEGAFSFSI